MELRGEFKVIALETKQTLVHVPNLIVYSGREALLPFVLKKVNPAIQVRPEWGLYWWGLGSGGLLDPADPSTRIIPTPNDTGLNNHLNLFDPSVPGTTSDGKYRTHVSVDYVQDVAHGNRQLIASLSLRVGKNEFNGVSINEAGLFLSDSPYPNNATSFVLFSKVTFNSVVKQNTFSLLFQWFLYA